MIKHNKFGALCTDLPKAFCVFITQTCNSQTWCIWFQSYCSSQCTVISLKEHKELKETVFTVHVKGILCGVLQGYIFGPHLLNIFLCNLFLITKNNEFGSYTIDNSRYTAGETPENVSRNLEKEAKKYFKSFTERKPIQIYTVSFPTIQNKQKAKLVKKLRAPWNKDW